MVNVEVIDCYWKEVLWFYGVVNGCLLELVYFVLLWYLIVDIVVFLWLCMVVEFDFDVIGFLYVECWFVEIVVWLVV